MKNYKIYLILVIGVLLPGSTPSSYAVQYLDTSMVDGLRVQSAKRVVAGNFFEVKLISRKAKINGVCWWDWEFSNGFDVPKVAAMKKGVATVKVLPIQPGAGRMSFYCGSTRSNPSIGGQAQLYIAP